MYIIITLSVLFLVVMVYFSFTEERRLRRAQHNLDIRAALPEYYDNLARKVSNIKDSGDFLEIVNEAKIKGARIRESSAPDLNCQGLVIEQSFDILPGEELIDLAKNKTFITEMADELTWLALTSKGGDRVGIYPALSNLSYTILTRGKQKDGNTERKWLSKYIKDLQDCISALDEDDPAKAREIMRDWYKAWRTPKEPSITERPLPRETMALALIAAEAILGIYGDTLDWLNPNYIQQVNKQVNKLLKSVRDELEHAEQNKTIRESSVLNICDAQVFAARRMMHRVSHSVP